MKMKTSKSHPLRIGWLSALGPSDAAGGVGITFLPGKHGLAMDGARWARDLHADLEVIAQVKKPTLVVLATPAEYSGFRSEALQSATRAKDIELIEVSLGKGEAPPRGSEAFERLLTALTQLLTARTAEEMSPGRSIVIASASGLDRACMMAVAALVASGHTQPFALKAVRQVRGKHALKDAAQLACGVALGEAWQVAERERAIHRAHAVTRNSPAAVRAAFETLARLQAPQPDGRCGLPPGMPTYGRVATALGFLGPLRTQGLPAWTLHAEMEPTTGLAVLSLGASLLGLVEGLKAALSTGVAGAWTPEDKGVGPWPELLRQLESGEDEGQLQYGLSPPKVPGAMKQPRGNLARGSAQWLRQGLGPLPRWTPEQIIEAVAEKLHALATIGNHLADGARQLQQLGVATPGADDDPVATLEDFGMLLAFHATRRALQCRNLLHERAQLRKPAIAPSEKAALLRQVREVITRLVRSNQEPSTDFTSIGPEFAAQAPELHERLSSLYADRPHYSWLVYVHRYVRQVIENDRSHEWHAEDRLWHRVQS